MRSLCVDGTETQEDRESRRLLVWGTALFVMGLVNGFLIPVLPDARRALSAHLAGVQDGMVLWAFGLMWHRVALRERTRILVSAASIYSMYAIWMGLALSAFVVGDPNAAAAGPPVLRAAITALETSGSFAILGAAAGVIVGLVHHTGGVRDRRATLSATPEGLHS